MRRYVCLLFVVLLWGCTEQNPPPAPPASDQGAAISGKVLATMDARSYTYVQIDTGAETVWAAGPKTPVRAGDNVTLAPGTLMRDYHSATFDRTFAQIYFVPAIHADTCPAPHTTPQGPTLPSRNGGAASVAASLQSLPGGHTIAELRQQRDQLNGTQVTLRGVVTKVNEQIMGRNWVHLQDATTVDGADLTVTTTQQAAAGQIVIVRGTLACDRDFGYGYRYDILVEDAQLTIEHASHEAKPQAD